MATATEAEPTQRLEPFELTADVFTRMVESGLFPENRRVCLLDGRLYEKMAKTRAHGSIGASVTRGIDRRLPDDWSLWPESTLVLDPTNVPLPDFAVIRSGELFGRANPERYPEARDVGLLIEVAVTSLRKDLTSGLERYARAMIPAYWVVDVSGRRILSHSEPRLTAEGRGEYGRVEAFGPGQEIPLVLDGQEVARVPFDDLLR
jgi:Uma2 family endonuclease